MSKHIASNLKNTLYLVQEHFESEPDLALYYIQEIQDQFDRLEEEFEECKKSVRKALHFKYALLNK